MRLRDGCGLGKRGAGGRCARAASGQAAAPPSSVKKSRRFMSGMGTSSPMRYQRR